MPFFPCSLFFFLSCSRSPHLLHLASRYWSKRLRHGGSMQLSFSLSHTVLLLVICVYSSSGFHGQGLRSFARSRNKKKSSVRLLTQSQEKTHRVQAHSYLPCSTFHWYSSFVAVAAKTSDNPSSDAIIRRSYGPWRNSVLFYGTRSLTPHCLYTCRHCLCYGNSLNMWRIVKPN